MKMKSWPVSVGIKHQRVISALGGAVDSLDKIDDPSFEALVNLCADGSDLGREDIHRLDMPAFLSLIKGVVAHNKPGQAPGPTSEADSAKTPEIKGAPGGFFRAFSINAPVQKQAQDDPASQVYPAGLVGGFMRAL